MQITEKNEQKFYTPNRPGRVHDVRSAAESYVKPQRYRPTLQSTEIRSLVTNNIYIVHLYTSCKYEKTINGKEFLNPDQITLKSNLLLLVSRPYT